MDVSYSGGTARFSTTHFSTWAIVYDVPQPTGDDDDSDWYIEYLRELKRQRETQRKALEGAQTEKESEEQATVLAAAAVAGVLLAIVIALRKKI